MKAIKNGFNSTCHLCLLLAVTCLCKPTSTATTFYVAPAPQGDNSTGVPDNRFQPYATIQYAYNLASAGDTVCLLAGVYRKSITDTGPFLTLTEKATAQNPITIKAAPEEYVVLKGSVDASGGWTQYPGTSIWMKIWGNDYPQQVFVHESPDYESTNPAEDEELLRQIGWPNPEMEDYPDRYTPLGTDATPGSFGFQNAAFSYMLNNPGTFFWSDCGLMPVLYVHLPGGANPNTKGIEVSVVPWFVTGGTLPNGTKLSMYTHFEGLRFRHSNSMEAGSGGWHVFDIGNDNVFETCYVQWTDGMGLFLGDHSKAVDCELAHNGVTGAGAGNGENPASGVEFDHCKIFGNNYRNFSTSWHAGGLKLIPAIRGSVHHCVIYDNNGPGVWFDTCYSGDPITISHNYVHDNKFGIFVEYTHGALVYNNVVEDNEYNGIFIAGGSNCEVYNNTIAGTWCGDSGYNPTETNSPYHAALRIEYRSETWNPTGNLVKNNVFYCNSTKDVFMNLTNANFLDNNCYYRVNAAAPLLEVLWLVYPTTRGWIMNLQEWKTTAGFDLNSISEDPQFVGGSAVDAFRLQASSPVIDNGVAVLEVGDDYLGFPRPKGTTHDIGAFEYDSYSDDFNRTNSSPMSQPSNGGSWDVESGALNPVRIVNNYVAADDITSGAKLTAPSFGANQSAQVTIGGAGAGVGVAVRMQSGNSCAGYLLYTDSSSLLQIYKVTDNGSFSASPLGASFYAPHSVGDTFRLRVTGSSTTVLEVFLNGTSCGTRTDSISPYVSGQPGIYLGGAGCALDSFTASEVAE